MAVVLNAGGLAVQLFLVGPYRGMSSPIWLTSVGLWLGLTGFGFMLLRRKRSAQAEHKHIWQARIARRSQYYLASAYVCFSSSFFAFALGCLVLFSSWMGRP